MVENKSVSSRIRVVIIYVLVILTALACFLPIWNTVCASMSSAAAIAGNRVGFWPVQFTIEAYTNILKDDQFWRSFGISVVRVILALIINLSMIVLMAYPLSKSKEEFHGRNIYMGLVVFAMLFSGGMIPGYMIVKKLGLLNTVWALILPGAVPIGNMIMVMNFFVGIPKSLEEAAIIDGANPMQVLLKVYLPCSKPSLATMALFSIVGHWNDFYSGLLYITKVRNYPIMSYIQSLRIDISAMIAQGVDLETLETLAKVSNENLNAAKIVISTVPLLIIYPLLQRYLLGGIVVGAVKE